LKQTYKISDERCDVIHNGGVVDSDDK